jgi:hypothetical protein
MFLLLQHRACLLICGSWALLEHHRSDIGPLPMTLHKELGVWSSHQGKSTGVHSKWEQDSDRPKDRHGGKAVPNKKRYDDDTSRHQLQVGQNGYARLSGEHRNEYASGVYKANAPQHRYPVDHRTYGRHYSGVGLQEELPEVRIGVSGMKVVSSRSSNSQEGHVLYVTGDKEIGHNAVDSASNNDEGGDAEDGNDKTDEGEGIVDGTETADDNDIDDNVETIDSDDDVDEEEENIDDDEETSDDDEENIDDDEETIVEEPVDIVEPVEVDNTFVEEESMNSRELNKNTPTYRKRRRQRSRHLNTGSKRGNRDSMGDQDDIEPPRGFYDDVPILHDEDHHSTGNEHYAFEVADLARLAESHADSRARKRRANRKGPGKARHDEHATYPLGEEVHTDKAHHVVEHHSSADFRETIHRS